jgi:hypothetical protein
MSKIVEFTPKFLVDRSCMPEKKEDGVLYISMAFNLAIHKCACGCGIETVMPFKGPHSWNFTNNEGKITFSPSILNPFPLCNSHYYIEENKVRWC